MLSEFYQLYLKDYEFSTYRVVILIAQGTILHDRHHHLARIVQDFQVRDFDCWTLA